MLCLDCVDCHKIRCHTLPPAPLFFDCESVEGATHALRTHPLTQHLTTEALDEFFGPINLLTFEQPLADICHSVGYSWPSAAHGREVSTKTCMWQVFWEQPYNLCALGGLRVLWPLIWCYIFFSLGIYHSHSWSIPGSLRWTHLLGHSQWCNKLSTSSRHNLKKVFPMNSMFLWLGFNVWCMRFVSIIYFCPNGSELTKIKFQNLWKTCAEVGKSGKIIKNHQICRKLLKLCLSLQMCHFHLGQFQPIWLKNVWWCSLDFTDGVEIKKTTRSLETTSKFDLKL